MLAGATGVAHALFSASTASTGTSVGTKRIFPGAHTYAAWSIGDASSSVEVNASEPLSAAGDGRTTTTGAWGTAFAANRWYQADYANVLPDGVAVSVATVRLTLSSTTGTTCVWFEVTRRSNGFPVASRGSPTTPFGCAGTTATTLTSQINEVTTTTVADDLRVRVYGRNTASSTAVLDELTITGTTVYGPYSLLPVVTTNAATGTSVVNRWSVATAGDGSVYGSASNWKGTYDPGRWIRFAFPAEVPTAATVTSVTFDHTYRDQDGVSACYWFEVYAGTTLIGSHGSTTVPYCSTGLAYRTDSIPLPEATTAAAANSLSLKLFVWDGSGTKRTQHDAATLTVNYYLN
jgi:hypothetical protein